MTHKEITHFSSIHKGGKYLVAGVALTGERGNRLSDGQGGEISRAALEGMISCGISIVEVEPSPLLQLDGPTTGAMGYEAGQKVYVAGGQMGYISSTYWDGIEWSAYVSLDSSARRYYLEELNPSEERSKP